MLHPRNNQRQNPLPHWLCLSQQDIAGQQQSQRALTLYSSGTSKLSKQEEICHEQSIPQILVVCFSTGAGFNLPGRRAQRRFGRRRLCCCSLSPFFLAEEEEEDERSFSISQEKPSSIPCPVRPDDGNMQNGRPRSTGRNSLSIRLTSSTGSRSTLLLKRSTGTLKSLGSLMMSVSADTLSRSRHSCEASTT